MIEAKTASGRSSESAIQTGTFLPPARSYSLKEVNATTQRCSGDSQRRQCGLFVLRMFVTPGSVLRSFVTNFGDGMPQRIIVNSRSPSYPFRTTGASMSGKTPGRLGRLPVRSVIALVNCRIAA